MPPKTALVAQEQIAPVVILFDSWEKIFAWLEKYASNFTFYSELIKQTYKNLGGLLWKVPNTSNQEIKIVACFDSPAIFEQFVESVATPKDAKKQFCYLEDGTLQLLSAAEVGELAKDINYDSSQKSTVVKASGLPRLSFQVCK